MKEDINALDELNKGALMGAYSINYILEKVEDKKLVKILEVFLNKLPDFMKVNLQHIA